MYLIPGVSAQLNALLYLLLPVIALLLLSGTVFYSYDPARLGRMPKHLELPQSFLLVVWALIVWRSGAADTAFWALGLFVSGGIAFGFLGDLFMADVFRQKDHVLFGMGAFAIGHILYMLGFRQIALALDLHNTGSYAAALVVMWLVAFVFWRLVIRTPDGDVMQTAALAYALFLASMAAYAAGLALQHSAFWPLAMGAVLFLLSDMLIAAQLFAGRAFRYMGDLIWVTYIAAQILIVTVLPVTLWL